MARLMGGMEIKKTSGPEPGFRLNLFTTDEEEEYVSILFSFASFRQGLLEPKWPQIRCVAENALNLLVLLALSCLPLKSVRLPLSSVL